MQTEPKNTGESNPMDNKPMHTPGPWKSGHMGDCENAWIGPDYDEPLVAKVDRNDRDEWEANARLITAAPELLGALAAIVDYPLPHIENDEARLSAAIAFVDFARNLARAELAKVRRQ